VLVVKKDETTGQEKRDFLEGSTPEISALGSQEKGRTRDFIEGSTPEISAMGSQGSASETHEEAGEQMLSEVAYGRRRERMMLSGLDIEEVHTRIREEMGIPAGKCTGLQWEREGDAIRFTMVDAWASERAWYEEQGIHMRTGQRKQQEEVAIEAQAEGSSVVPIEVEKGIGTEQLVRRIAGRFGIEGSFELLADGREPEEPFKLTSARRYEILRREEFEKRMQSEEVGPVMAQITMIHGKSCERTSVRIDMTEGELRREMVRRFGADPGERWCVRTMDGMYNPQAFKIHHMWVYTLEEETQRDTRIRLGAPQ
jgi:hypothetical protein